jgi:hypothetical protein
LQVGLCFSLSGNYKIAYKDDDGEETEIGSEHDFREAVQYFSEEDASTEASPSSDTTVARVVMKVFVLLEYDGPSLSDATSFTESLLSCGSEFEGSDWASVRRDSRLSDVDQDRYYDSQRFRYLPSRQQRSARRQSSDSSSSGSFADRERGVDTRWDPRRPGERSHELLEDDDWKSVSSDSDRTSATTPEQDGEPALSRNGIKLEGESVDRRGRGSRENGRRVSGLSTTSSGASLWPRSSVDADENGPTGRFSSMSELSLVSAPESMSSEDEAASDALASLRLSSRNSTFSMLSLVPDEFLKCSSCDSIMADASIMLHKLGLFC